MYLANIIVKYISFTKKVIILLSGSIKDTGRPLFLSLLCHLLLNGWTCAAFFLTLLLLTLNVFLLLQSILRFTAHWFIKSSWWIKRKIRNLHFHFQFHFTSFSLAIFIHKLNDGEFGILQIEESKYAFITSFQHLTVSRISGCEITQTWCNEERLSI